MTHGASPAGLLAVDIGNSRIKFGWYSAATLHDNHTLLSGKRFADKDVVGRGFVERGFVGRDGNLPSPGSLSPNATEGCSTENHLDSNTSSPRNASKLPLPDKSWSEDDGAEDGLFRPDGLGQWLLTLPLTPLPLGQAHCMIASVHKGTTDRLLQFFQTEGIADHFSATTLLRHSHLPMEIRTDKPERVGIDRLLVAVAANYLRAPELAGIAIDAGSAITVDLIAPDGAFEGGTILPGLRLWAEALHTETDALPQVTLGSLPKAPALPGRSTKSAIEAGLHWGMIGAVREIIGQLEATLGAPAELLVTGGHGKRLAQGLADTRHIIFYRPNLVLDGIVIAHHGHWP